MTNSDEIAEVLLHKVREDQKLVYAQADTINRLLPIVEALETLKDFFYLKSDAKSTTPQNL